MVRGSQIPLAARNNALSKLGPFVLAAKSATLEASTCTGFVGRNKFTSNSGHLPQKLHLNLAAGSRSCFGIAGHFVYVQHSDGDVGFGNVARDFTLQHDRVRRQTFADRFALGEAVRSVGGEM